MSTASVNVTRGIHTGIPGYFRGWCWTASHPGTTGYEQVGYQLAGVIGHEIPWDIEDDDWTQEINEFKTLLLNDDKDAALNWLNLHYPMMMKLVPTKRRQQLIIGVVRAFEDGLIDI
ncbi:MAG: hypothetical protein ABUS47_16505 [Steroidobacter sp.]